MYIEALENTTVSLNIVGTLSGITGSYQIGSSYNEYTFGTGISLTAGQKCYFNVDNYTTNFSTSNYLRFTSTGRINVGGSITSLIGASSTIPRAYCFYRLFYNCTTLINTEYLDFGDLADFNGKYNTFYQMFMGCSNLVTSPLQLGKNNTTHASSVFPNNTCNMMFYGCTSLTSVPDLWSSNPGISAYNSMFYGCTSLNDVPEFGISTGTTTSQCCYRMFYGCTSLKRLPKLAPSTLNSSCYAQMFYGCTNIKVSTTKTGDYTKAYRIPSVATGTDSSGNALSGMFTNTGGTFTGTPSINTTYYIVNDAPPISFCFEAVEDTTIVLTKTGVITGSSFNFGIDDNTCPNGWSPVYSSYTLPAGHKFYLTGSITATSGYSTSNYYTWTFTGKVKVKGNLFDITGRDDEIPANYVFYKWFYNCTQIVDISELNFHTNFNTYTDAYRQMFEGCTGITKLPKLPATTLKARCYAQMFKGCTGIKLSATQTGVYQIPYSVPSEGTGTTASDALTSMFYGTGGTFTGTPTINTTYYEAISTSFYIEAIQSTTVKLTKVGSPTVGTCYYGINTPSVSTSYTYGNSISLSAGQKCYFYITSSGSNFSTSNYLKFTSTSNINVGGNITDLLGGANPSNNFCLYCLFYQCPIVDASNLILNFSDTTNNLCECMFMDCTSLTTPPQLPCTNLKNACYSAMFVGCTSLTQAPSLPATSLPDYCYYEMFYACTSLTQAPDLPATTIGAYCYAEMFYNCQNLVTPPSTIPITTATEHCCESMFYACKKLSSTPLLPTTTLADSCYMNMFYGCTSLTSLPQLPATTLISMCYYMMFYACTNIKVSSTQVGTYTLPYRIPTSGTGVTETYALYQMFGATGGTFTGSPAINTTYYLSDGTFYIEAVENTTIKISKNGSSTVFPSTTYGINDSSTPNAYALYQEINLTAGQKCYFKIASDVTSYSVSKYVYFISSGKINVGGRLSDLIGGNTTIQRQYCFNHLFYNCPVVDASNLDFISDLNGMSGVYYYMFADCTELVTPPAELPATVGAEACYSYMFSGCSKLATPPTIKMKRAANQSMYYMFYNCTSLQYPADMLVTTFASMCCEAMYWGCSSMKLSTTQTGYYTRTFRIPKSGSCTQYAGALSNMFVYTTGTWKGTPDYLTTYYVYDGPLGVTVTTTYNGSTISTQTEVATPVSITYNGSSIASFSSGTKTLKCNGKVMSSDVVVASKTLKCNGKVMNSDVVVSIT